MNRKPHHRIDVNIFKDILRKKHCPDDELRSSKRILLETIQKINTINIVINGIDIDKQKELKNINIREYGFKERCDVKIEFVKDIIENKSIIVLIPKTIYELEDKIELPTPINNKGKLYLMFMADTFERLKVKAESIIRETEETKQIGLYARKNIQMAQRIFYDARMIFERVQAQGTKTDVFVVFVQNIFLMNVILYLQNMFSSFYNEKLLTRKDLKIDLYDTIKMNFFFDIDKENNNSINENLDNEIDCVIKWNGQVNVLITFFYDLVNEKMTNKKMLMDASIDDIQYLLNKYFVDKNGKPISKETINTCMKDYREDKRATGNKRIDISKYLLIEE